MDKLSEKTRGHAGNLLDRGTWSWDCLESPALVHVACRAGADLGTAGHWGDRPRKRKARREPASPPQSRLTPRVGPKGHGPIALHQMRPLKAVFVLETAVWQLGLGARGAGSRSVASRAVAPDELAERQQ